LNNSFFEAQKPNEELLSRYSNIWPDGVVPIAEWDGILYLAALAPTEGFTPPQKAQWVLAPWSKLSNWIGNETAEVDAIDDGMPMGLNLDAAPTTQFDMDSLLPDTDSPTDLQSSTEEPIELAPEGIQLTEAPPIGEGTETSTAQLNEAPGGLDLSGLNLDSNDGPSTAVIENPQGEELIELAPLPETVATKKVDLSFENLAPNDMSLPPSPDGDSVIELMPTAITPPPPSTIPVQEEAKTMTAAEPLVLEPTAVPVSNSSPAPEMNSPTASKPVSSPGGNDVSQFVFSKIPKSFEKSMILLFNDGKLEPWQWLGHWAQDKSRAKEIDLSTPSIFRIVKESLHPFHGPIVKNSINDAFFATWNQGQYPEHITIVPIKSDQNLLGMILGCARSDQAKSIMLERVQDLGIDTGKMILSAKAA
ncbi:MAG: hypothetical protein KDD25_07495, partial [Bdellovibrionales bacterium]|nr:hypothetical protein [Bdellovibrionales bacterium]